MKRKLKPVRYRDRQFVDALFLTTRVMYGAEAVRAVGFSRASAPVLACRLLIKVNAKAAIEDRRRAVVGSSWALRKTMEACNYAEEWCRGTELHCRHQPFRASEK